MFNWMLSLLVHKAVITEKEAEYLSPKLANSIQASNFSDAHKMMAKLIDDYEKSK